MKRIILLVTSAVFLFACDSNGESGDKTTGDSTAKKHTLVKKWETDTILKVPESVLYDSKNQVLYVSNIDGTDPWQADGKGSIGKVGMDGKIIAVDWVSGLHAPKGMGLHNGMLYVADMTSIVVINTETGKIERMIPVTGAAGLNDISVDSKGVVYVSDSRGRKIFRVENGNTQLYLDNLRSPNGVLMRGNDFYILDNGGIYQVGPDRSLTKITDGMAGGTDGIENVEGNDFIISCWGGVLWYVNADGTKEMLKDTRTETKGNTADIGYDPATKTVYVPTFWKNSVIAYQISEE